MTIFDDEQAARDLVDALHRAGLKDAVLHWDRSPWGARIPLTEDRGEYATPSLYVLVEETREIAGVDTPDWFGALGDFDGGGPIDSDLYDTGFRWVQRVHLGETVDDVARRIATLVTILKTAH